MERGQEQQQEQWRGRGPMRAAAPQRRLRRAVLVAGSLAGALAGWARGGMVGLRGGAATGALAGGLSGGVMASLTGCAALDRWERQAALRPTPTKAEHVAAFERLRQPGDTQLSGEVDGQRVALWWFPRPEPDAPALLYLHGTFRNLYQNAPKIDALRRAGLSVLAVDYRGWGDSAAIVPSEATITRDAELAWTQFERLQPDARRRIVYGHSMGGAVAARLAAAHPGAFAGLILESSFTRMADVASAAGFWGRVAGAVTSLAFDTEQALRRVRAPVLLLHGAADRTVPIELGRRLAQVAHDGQLIAFDGGSHSGLHREDAAAYEAAVRAFVARVAAAAPG